MNRDHRQLTAAITVKPGEEQQLVHSTGSDLAPGTCLAIHPFQEESSDDGGSQSPVGTLIVGTGEAAVRIQFDIRDGTVIPVPRTSFQVRVRNANESPDPTVVVSAFPVISASPPEMTRTVDIGFGMEDPNVRVPAFAHSVFYDHGRPDLVDYRALMSDSATGETYGQVAPYTRHPLHQRARFIRFMNMPSSSMGTAVFFISI